MIVTKKAGSLRAHAAEWRCEKDLIGFVPTMGYLHEGHLSLIRKAKEKADKVVVSIFVNPTQFGPNEDLDSYPRNLERDKALVEQEGVDLLFCPDAGAMYDPESASWVEVPSYAKGLCAQSRPTHFRGVCTIVTKLFNLVTPDFAFFGEKDWQQLAIIKRMVKDLMMPIDVIGCPIVREEDGLAQSSRNVNLTPEERKEAIHLSNALKLIETKAKAGSSECKALLKEAKSYIEKKCPLGRLDYLEAVHPETLEPLSQIETNALFAIAVKFSIVRLIDNRLVSLNFN